MYVMDHKRILHGKSSVEGFIIKYDVFLHGNLSRIYMRQHILRRYNFKPSLVPNFDTMASSLLHVVYNVLNDPNVVIQRPLS